MTTYYKGLTTEGFGPYSGFDWNPYLPKDNGKPGKWLKVEGALEMCSNGIHVCTREQIAPWIDAQIVEMECSGAREEAGDKVCFRNARIVRVFDTWNERRQRLFAADCAEHVLHIFTTYNPADERPQAAINMARAFANGNATQDEQAAAQAAARDAAGDAARAAALDAAGDAERDAERKWQTDILFEYLHGERG